jgi:glucose/arabinose dehydrogenase
MRIPARRLLPILLLSLTPFAVDAACVPIETRPANARDQKPDHAGQTRACGVRTQAPIKVTVVAKGLERPWSVEPLPDGRFLVSEKAGRLRLVGKGGEIGPPIRNVPPVDDGGQGGLLDVALGPSFDVDRAIYFAFSERRDNGGNATSIARALLSADGASLEQVKVIFRALPAYRGNYHFGSRIAFGPDGMLYLTTGDRSDASMRRLAQEKDNHMGKVLRLLPDGNAPAGNPFAGQGSAKPEVWSLGHRNPQSLAFDAQGRLWAVEHGTQGGDELNLIVKGRNYGWPIQAYGQEYSGRPIPGATTNPGGFEQPVYYWDPVIAPSGLQAYSGKLVPEWKGNLFVGGLRGQALVRLVLEGDRVVGEEHLLADRGQRIRDVREGPDGALYVVTDQASGELWRIAP